MTNSGALSAPTVVSRPVPSPTDTSLTLRLVQVARRSRRAQPAGSSPPARERNFTSGRPPVAGQHWRCARWGRARPRLRPRCSRPHARTESFMEMSFPDRIARHVPHGAELQARAPVTRGQADEGQWGSLAPASSAQPPPGSLSGAWSLSGVMGSLLQREDGGDAGSPTSSSAVVRGAEALGHGLLGIGRVAVAAAYGGGGVVVAATQSLTSTLDTLVEARARPPRPPPPAGVCDVTPRLTPLLRAAWAWLASAATRPRIRRHANAARRAPDARPSGRRQPQQPPGGLRRGPLRHSRCRPVGTGIGPSLRRRRAPSRASGRAAHRPPHQGSRLDHQATAQARRLLPPPPPPQRRCIRHRRRRRRGRPRRRRRSCRRRCRGSCRCCWQRRHDWRRTTRGCSARTRAFTSCSRSARRTARRTGKRRRRRRPGLLRSPLRASRCSSLARPAQGRWRTMAMRLRMHSSPLPVSNRACSDRRTSSAQVSCNHRSNEATNPARSLSVTYLSGHSFPLGASFPCTSNRIEPIRQTQWHPRIHKIMTEYRTE